MSILDSRMRSPLTVRRRTITTIDTPPLASIRACPCAGAIRTFDAVGRRVSAGLGIGGHTPPAHPGAIRTLRRPARAPRLLARRCSAPRRDFAGGRVTQVGKALYAIDAARHTPEPYRWDGDPNSAQRSDILTLPFRDIGAVHQAASAIVRCRLDLGKTCGKSRKVNSGSVNSNLGESGAPAGSSEDGRDDPRHPFPHRDGDGRFRRKSPGQEERVKKRNSANTKVTLGDRTQF